LSKDKVPSNDSHHLERSSAIYMYTLTFLFLFIMLNLQSPWKAPAVITTREEASSASVSYATYNKLYISDNLDAAYRIFEQSDVDIVSFQEITSDEIDHYSEKLGFEYSDITNSSASAGGSEIGIVSRYEIISSNSIELTNTTIALRSEIRLPGGDIIAVYTVHIPPPFSPGAYSSGVKSLNALSMQIQNEQLPVLMAGDFNTTVYSPKFKKLHDDVSDKLQLAFNDQTPACSWFGPGPLCMRIDHLFYSDEFTLEQIRIEKYTGSDHRIVSTMLRY